MQTPCLDLGLLPNWRANGHWRLGGLAAVENVVHQLDQRRAVAVLEQDAGLPFAVVVAGRTHRRTIPYGQV